MGWLFHSIKGRIMLMVVLVIGLGFSTFEAYDYTASKADALYELEGLADIKADRLAENLALPLWEVDEAWAAQVIEAEMADKRIHAVTVVVDGERFLARMRDDSWHIADTGDDAFEDDLVRIRTIMHDEKVFGELQMFVTKKFMYEELYHDLLWESLALLMISLLMLAVLMFALNRIVVTRVQKVLAAAEAIGTGDYSVRLSQVSGNDELGQLVDGIELMKRRIEEREGALKESESRFRSLVDHAGDAFYLVDMEGQIIDVSQSAVQAVGYRREELLGLTVTDIQGAFSLEKLKSIWLKMGMDKSVTVEGVHRRKGGSTFPVEVRISKIERNGEPQLIALARDITDRKQAELKVRRYSQAMEQSGEAIVVADAEGVIEHINPAFTEITGYSEDEAIGSKTSILKSGHQDVATYAQMWKTITAGKTWRGKVINRRKSGELYPAMLTISPIIEDDGHISRYIGIQQNLEQMEALEMQFRQSQKMEAIGTLVGGIAHDFNNTLAGITGNLYLAKKEAESLPKVVERLKSVEGLAFGAASTIQQLLAFSRKGMVNMAPVAIAPFLKETMKLQQASIAESINSSIEVADSNLTVRCDVNQIQQVLMNLINNAVDAVAGVKNPSVKVQLDQFDADETVIAKDERFHKGGYAHIRVMDNGTGIKADHIEHLFEPFFTTKAPDKGTGLGLAMVYGAIQTHNGVIEINSSQDEPSGTTVHVYLPLVQAPAATDEPDEVVGDHGSETILVVDDNALVLKTAEDVLGSLGYKVLSARDGQTAIEVYKEHQNEIALLILDVVMPGMGGVDTLRAIRELNPSIKAMFATGYDKGTALQELESGESIEVIGKPFTVAELSRAIRSTLDA